MIKKLILKNFLAHGDTVLDLAPGLNVLTGPNNTGKSAVVEGLRCLATNPAPRHVIRHGADEARVEAVFEDGTRLAWVRKARYALYELFAPGAQEPEVFAKFGRTPPEEVLAVLKLNQVFLETGEEIDCHLGNQREPVFLLNRPGSAVAAFFAASSESAHLIAMQGLLKERTRKGKIEQKRLVRRLEAVRSDLDALAPLPGVERGLEVGREKLSGVEVLARRIPALEAHLIRREKLNADLAARGETLAALAGAAPPPELWPAAALAGHLALSGRLAVRREEVRAKCEALADLRPPETLADAAAIARTAVALRRTRAALDAAGEKARALSSLGAPPARSDLSELARHLGQTRLAIQKKRAAARRLDVLAPLAPPPVPADLSAPDALCREMRRTLARVREKEAALGDVKKRLEAVAAAAQARIEALGACPLCGGDMDAEKFLSGGHIHAASKKRTG